MPQELFPKNVPSRGASQIVIKKEILKFLLTEIPEKFNPNFNPVTKDKYAMRIDEMPNSL
ncbi:MAG: hypothetical protein PF484_08070, partial [Bacteroidales bacterium]|nr:hypothetical protein [Bacteroidales bacterium]